MWFYERMDEERRTEFDSMLVAPIEGVRPSEEAMQAEADGFMSFMSAVT